MLFHVTVFTLSYIPCCSAAIMFPTPKKCVNIFHKRVFCVTIYTSVCCKTYCFAFQKRRFCTVKAAVLQCKTAAFAMLKRSYHFLTELSLQSKGYFLALPLRNKGKADVQQVLVRTRCRTSKVSMFADCRQAIKSTLIYALAGIR